MRVLLLSFACEPGQGSEAGISWHWVTDLAKHHDVYVLTHPRGREAITREMDARPNPRLHFDFVELPDFLDPWRRDPGEKQIHLRYILWQFAQYLAARKLVREQEFDVVHHLSWITITGPTLGWALGLPFIWGPVGSGQIAPLQMRRHLGMKGWILEALRNIEVKLVGLNPLSRMAARKSVAAIATNFETADALKRLGARNIPFIYCSAVDDHWIPKQLPKRLRHDKPIVAWLGRLEPRKTPSLAIEAFATARSEQPCELWMIGDGSLLEPMRDLAGQLGVADHVRFWGRVPHGDIPKLLLDADMFLFTSLRDSCTAVVLEAMALGLPAVSIDHQGVRILPDDVVLKVPVSDADTIVEDLAQALAQLARSPEERAHRALKSWRHVREHELWSHRYDAMRDVYAELFPGEVTPKNHLAHERAR